MREALRRGWAPALVLLAIALGVGPARAATVGTSILDDYSRACAAVANAIKPSVVFIAVRERTQVTSAPVGERPAATGAAADPPDSDRTAAEGAEASGVVIERERGHSYERPRRRERGQSHREHGRRAVLSGCGGRDGQDSRSRGDPHQPHPTSAARGVR